MTLDECVEEVSDGYLVDAVHVVGVAVRQRDLHRLQERPLKVLQTESNKHGVIRMPCKIFMLQQSDTFNSLLKVLETNKTRHRNQKHSTACSSPENKQYT